MTSFRVNVEISSLTCLLGSNGTVLISAPDIMRKESYCEHVSSSICIQNMLSKFLNSDDCQISLFSRRFKKPHPEGKQISSLVGNSVLTYADKNTVFWCSMPNNVVKLVIPMQKVTDRKSVV